MPTLPMEPDFPPEASTPREGPSSQTDPLDEGRHEREKPPAPPAHIPVDIEYPPDDDPRGAPPSSGT